MTEYYGNSEDRRLVYINGFRPSEINDATYPIGFINSKGMLMEYIIKNYTEGTSLTHSKGKTAIKKNTEDPVWYFDDRAKNLKKIKYDGEEYWVGTETRFVDEYYVVYKELPKFINDDNFKWHTNVKYQSLETTISSGAFDYHCIARESGDAYISVMYTKCENKHRNKVTLAEITVYDASNEAILETIRKWKAEFVKDME